MSGPGRSDTWTVLMVCTGNLCRSPLAEHLAAAHFPPETTHRPVIRSAGVHAQPDEPMHPHAAALLRARGCDPDGFRSRRLTTDLVETSDLVLCATREHRSTVVGLAPRALRRTYTMREFGRLTSAVRPADIPIGEVRPACEFLVSAAWDARCAGRVVPASLDDLSDPIKEGRTEFETCAAMIEDALSAPMSLLAQACRAWQAVPRPRRATSDAAARVIAGGDGGRSLAAGGRASRG
jgi:protein-tyrosine phosphatase